MRDQMQSHNDVNEGISSVNQATVNEAEPNQVQEGADEVEDPNAPSITNGHYIIAYGPKTIKAIEEAIACSFKLFWDGAISMHIDTSLSS